MVVLSAVGGAPVVVPLISSSVLLLCLPLVVGVWPLIVGVLPLVVCFLPLAVGTLSVAVWLLSRSLSPVPFVPWLWRGVSSGGISWIPLSGSLSPVCVCRLCGGWGGPDLCSTPTDFFWRRC